MTASQGKNWEIHLFRGEEGTRWYLCRKKPRIPSPVCHSVLCGRRASRALRVETLEDLGFSPAQNLSFFREAARSLTDPETLPELFEDMLC